LEHTQSDHTEEEYAAIDNSPAWAAVEMDPILMVTLFNFHNSKLMEIKGILTELESKISRTLTLRRLTRGKKSK
jgi:hypothetical protein